MGKFTTEYFIAASKFIVGFKDLLPEDKNAVLEVMSPEEFNKKLYSQEVFKGGR